VHVALTCQDCNDALQVFDSLNAALPATLASPDMTEAVTELEVMRNNVLQLCRHLARCAVQRAAVDRAFADVAADGSGESAVLVLDFKVRGRYHWAYALVPGSYVCDLFSTLPWCVHVLLRC
jgi:hypothetical protein